MLGGRRPPALAMAARGEGVRLYTETGEEYLDCLAGIAVNALGHSHPRLVETLKAQAEKLWHVSNIFRIPGQEALATKLCACSFADVAFLTNSGTEAVELALKLNPRCYLYTGLSESLLAIQHGLKAVAPSVYQKP